MAERKDTNPAAGGERFVTTYPTRTPQELADELGLPLTKRRQPDFTQAVPRRLVPKEEALALGLSSFYDGRACRYSHQASRRTANENICSDCERQKKGLPTVYPKSRAQEFYEKPRRAAKDPSAPMIIAAPAATSAPEAPKKDLDFLAALDSTRSFELACEQTGVSRGQIEARLSANETFRRSVDDLCERRQIMRELNAPEVDTFRWSAAIEAKLVNGFIDTGLLQTARENLGISASQYAAHIERSPTFAAAIDAARPKARETLRDRAAQLAQVGNVNLLKLLEDDEPDSVSNMSVPQLNAEIERLMKRFDGQGLIAHPTKYLRKSTGELISASDLEVVETTHTRSDNSDLVGA